MPQPKRGRNSPKLAPLRLAPHEKEWVIGQCELLGCNMQQFQRARVLAGMPGYAVEVAPKPG